MTNQFNNVNKKLKNNLIFKKIFIYFREENN